MSVRHVNITMQDSASITAVQIDNIQNEKCYIFLFM